MQDQRRHDDLAAFEDAAAEIAARAAAVLRERFAAGRAPEPVEFKDKQQRDPVTKTDRAVEEIVRRELRARFPDHGILGEEGTGEAVSSELLWVLDPIDGTANFAGRLPFFGISLALLRNGVPIVGCLWVPFWPTAAGGILRASLGRGARLEGQPLRLDAGPFRPSGPVAVPPGLHGMFQVKGDLAKRFGEARNLGSMVAELAMVATGGFQYAVFGAPRLWDVAAGVLIVQEAGGSALTWEGGRWRPVERFRVPRTRPGGKPKTLRDWMQPVLVAGPGAVRHVGSGLRPRRPPGPAVRWLLAKRRVAREWWKKRRRPAGSSDTSGASRNETQDQAPAPGGSTSDVPAAGGTPASSAEPGGA